MIAGYPGQTIVVSPPMQTAATPSLLSDSAKVFQQLLELNDRLVKLGDHLLGTEPREASAKNDPEPIPSVHRNLMRAQQVANDCLEALTRIETRS